MAHETSKDNILERILDDPSVEPTNLPLSLLQDITKNFSEDQIIGEGGFAAVYKGSLKNGTVVAVKKLMFQTTEIDNETFVREVHSLMKLKHKNIVRFLGFCSNTEQQFFNNGGKNVLADKQQKLLCFEFMPKGSLDQHITEANKGLEWKTRYQILKGICEGLHYLHMNRILHLDLKPANILLNDNMEPKISDFGLSRGLAENQSRIITSKLYGTMGYIAPECHTDPITFKSDIYSLGIIIFEILRGRKWYTAVDEVLESWRTRLTSPQGDARLEQVRVCTEIGTACINIDPTKRPDIQRIIKTLHETEEKYGFTENRCTSPTKHENQDLLIKYISQDLGFPNGNPIAACLIYRCLLHWRSFEVERAGIFNSIIQTIGSAVEDNNKLAYWMSNSSSLLLLLLQQTLETTGAAGLGPQRHRSSTASFRRWMRASSQSAGPGDIHQVEANYPTLLFKQQLTGFLEKIYGMIRDNLKKEISPLLGLCIQAPRTSHAILTRGAYYQSNALAYRTLIAHWHSIVKIMTDYLNVLIDNCVPSYFIRKLFTQIFSCINVELFNSVLLRHECCSFSNGEYLKVGLEEFKKWCIYATVEYAGYSWEELTYIRQAVGFLVSREKTKKTLEEILDLCSSLSIRQLHRISTMYWDMYGTHSVSSEVMSRMNEVVAKDLDTAARSPISFVLDDDSSIPFTVYDLCFKIRGIKASDVDMPSFILENSGFAFLQQRDD